MDVKAIANTQASMALNTQNSSIEMARMKIPSDPAQQEQKAHLTKEQIEKITQELQKKLDMFSTQLQITIDPQLKEPIVRVVDGQTKEVIRQLPPESLLKIAKYIDEITGLLFEKKA